MCVCVCVCVREAQWHCSHEVGSCEPSQWRQAFLQSLQPSSHYWQFSDVPVQDRQISLQHPLKLRVHITHTELNEAALTLLR